MKASVKKIISFTSLVLLSFICIFCLYGCSADKREANTHSVDTPFSKISINASVSEIVIKPSADGKCKAECLEYDNLKYSVLVSGDTLKIDELDTRKWYNKLFGFKSPSIVLYLPMSTYNSLTVNNTTGDVTVEEGIIFGSIDIEFTTGRASCYADSIGEIKIEGTTGEIKAEDFSAASVSLITTTGDISASNINCIGSVYVEFTSGDANLSGIRCGSFSAEGSTGEISMNDVIALGKMNLSLGTGDVEFRSCDAAEVYIETTTGDISGSFLTPKIIHASTSTGDVDVPEYYEGGKCKIKTSTGDIEIDIAK